MKRDNGMSAAAGTDVGLSYSAPRITVLGSLEELTLGPCGGTQDGELGGVTTGTVGCPTII